MDKLGFLGIDVSKGYADFVLLNQEKEELGKCVKYYDSSKGHSKLLHFIKKVKKQYGLTKIICGVESTGGYENNWYNMLSANEKAYNVEVYRLNPRGVKHQGASKLTRTVTDRVSAVIIGNQLIENQTKIRSTPKPSVELSEARSFYRTIQSLSSTKTRMSNQLEKLVYSAFPELFTFKKDGLPKWAYRFLSTYEGREKLLRKRLPTLLRIKGLVEEPAIKLQQVAKESIGKESPALIRSINRIASNILLLEKQIKEDKKYLETNYTSPEVELLTTIKGIGAYTAIGAMMEIEDIARFESASKMAAFFGTHPVFKISGDGSRKPRMSKQGSKNYRAVLYMGAKGVLMHNPYFKEIYAKFRAKGMKHFAAQGVIMHKLTKVFFGMLKRNKPFDEKVDKSNIEKNKQVKAKVQQESNIARIKEEIIEMSEAPVSYRTSRKLKAQLMSQVSESEASTRSTIELNQT